MTNDSNLIYEKYQNRLIKEQDEVVDKIDDQSTENREVEIGNEIIAIVDIITDVSSPESRIHAYKKIKTLAEELVNLHTTK